MVRIIQYGWVKMNRYEFRTKIYSSLNEIDVENAKLVDVRWLPFEVEQKVDFSLAPFSGKQVLLCVEGRVFQSSWSNPNDPDFDSTKDFYSGSMYNVGGYWLDPLDKAVKIWEPSHWASLDKIDLRIEKPFSSENMVYVPDIEKTQQSLEKLQKLRLVEKRKNWTILVKNPKWIDVFWPLDIDEDSRGDNQALKKIIIELPGFSILEGSKITGSMDPIWQ